MTAFSPQQLAFFETASSRDSICLIARAGSGKTFSLQNWANHARTTGIATSFSKATVTELGKKMPRKFQSMTMHSVGRQALVNAGKFSSLDTSKNYNIACKVIEDLELDKALTSDLMRLVSACKTYGIDPAGDCISPLTYDILLELAEFFDVDLTPQLFQAVAAALAHHISLSLEGIHDFDDFLYIPILLNLRLRTGITLIVDEDQDLSTLQHEMLSRMLMKGGRVIAAGDDRQAIYAFRGALSDSITQLSRRFSARILPLTVSFRCPQEVIRYAQRYVPDIEPAPNAPVGEVIFHSETLLDNLPHQILCRNNAPLIELALRIIASGKSAEVLGKDIGKGLISLTKRISKRNLTSDEFIGRLQVWAEKEVTKKPKSKARVYDKVATLQAIAAVHSDMAGIQKHLEKLYPDRNSSRYKPAEYQLSTIHRAKGLEWPEVAILDAHLMPSRYAEQDWELVQEDNLAYVACTRAQRVLHFINSESIV